MELQQLRYFLAVSDNGSLSKAANVVGVAQPALSRQIRQLEEELGVRLFYRHGRGIRMTEEGALFRASLVPLLRQLSQAVSDVRDAAKVPAGAVTLGMPPSMSAAIGAAIVSEFLLRHPQVKLRLVDGLSGYVNEWLAAGRIDMAVINNARKSPYVRMDPLLTVDLFLLGRRSDIESLALDQETFQTPDLAKLPLLLVGRNHGLRRALDTAMHRLGTELHIKAEVDALSALIQLVQAGCGFTVLPHGVLAPEGGRGDLARRRLVAPTLTQTFLLAFSLQRPTTLAMQELARCVRREVMKALSDGRMVGRMERPAPERK